MTAANKKPRYEGPFTVIGLDLEDKANFMMQEMFALAPYSESWQDSTRRLTNAIRDDGENELRPLTIWLAYRRHPELREPVNKTITNE